MSKNNSKGLGKGLGALLPSTIETSADGFKFVPKEGQVPEGENQVLETPMIRIDSIVLNQYQPRKEFDPEELEDLKNSIIENGVIQAITVRPIPDGYELISGERRLRASKLAGLETIPAHIIRVETDLELMALALVENLQRSDLNPIEVANAYKRMIEDCNLTHDEVSKRVGKERATVTNSLRLLNLPPRIQDSLRNREISNGHAKALLALHSPQNMVLAWQEIMQKELSVRATEALVRDINEGRFSSAMDTPKKPRKPKELPADIQAVIEEKQNYLRHIFGTQVRILPKDKKSGKIEIEFYSPDDMERILDIIAHSSNNEQ